MERARWHPKEGTQKGRGGQWIAGLCLAAWSADHLQQASQAGGRGSGVSNGQDKDDPHVQAQQAERGGFEHPHSEATRAELAGAVRSQVEGEGNQAEQQQGQTERGGMADLRPQQGGGTHVLLHQMEIRRGAIPAHPREVLMKSRLYGPRLHQSFPFTVFKD